MPTPTPTPTPNEIIDARVEAAIERHESLHRLAQATTDGTVINLPPASPATFVIVHATIDVAATNNRSCLAFVASTTRPGCADLAIDMTHDDVLSLAASRGLETPSEIDAFFLEHLHACLCSIAQSWRWAGAASAAVHATCIANPWLAATVWDTFCQSLDNDL